MHLDLQKFWSVWRVRCMRNGIKSLLKLWRNKQKFSPTCSHNCGVFYACSFSDLHSSHSATSLIIYQSCSELFFSHLLNHESCFFFSLAFLYAMRCCYWVLWFLVIEVLFNEIAIESLKLLFFFSLAFLYAMRC